MSIVKLPNDVTEESDSEYECVFSDAGAGQPQISAGSIMTITATLKDVATNTVINSRNNQNVLNANGGSVDVDGVFRLRLSGNLDNIIVTEKSTSGDQEEHSLTLKVTYLRPGAITGYLKHEVRFFIKHLKDA